MAIEPAASKPSEAQLASAVHAAVAEGPVGRDAEALAALIVAWRHHWPAAFTHAFGDGDALGHRDGLDRLECLARYGARPPFAH